MGRVIGDCGGGAIDMTTGEKDHHGMGYFESFGGWHFLGSDYQQDSRGSVGRKGAIEGCGERIG